uniref:Cell division protein n=1 Tax=Aphanochaete elegans TaxID=764105 RepID=A0A6H1XDK9_9CHLO|nr:cell division protein [Aphanochaete elegans]QJA13741.1 cell division protein [Aphanochaete elegans]
MYKKKSINFKEIKKRFYSLSVKKKYIFFSELFSSVHSLNQQKLTQVFFSFKSTESFNLKKSTFRLKASKVNLEYNLTKTSKTSKISKISIDWHSKDLLRKNDLGIWFYNCFQPFSTRKYWWILLPSQTLLFRLRWETMSKLKLSNQTQQTNLYDSSFDSLNWFNEKPLYIYWILPFFGCLNIISFSFLQEIKCISPIFETSKSLSDLHAFLSTSETLAPKTLLLSWETLNYLTYKKNLLDLSGKFIQKINYYHDSIIYQVSPTWFNYFQEHYIATYSDRNIYDPILENYQVAQQNITIKNKKYLNHINTKNFSDLYIQKNNHYNNKIEYQKIQKIEFWWNQEMFTQKNSFELLPFKLLTREKQIMNISDSSQKSSLLKILRPVLKNDSNLTILEFLKSDYIWNNFVYQKSQIKWCWHTLSMNKNPFVRKYSKLIYNNFSLSGLFFKNDETSLINQFNFIKNNLLESSQKNAFSKTKLNESNLLKFVGFDNFNFSNLFFDEFAQKLLLGNITLPLNYLSSTLLDKKLSEFDFYDFYFRVNFNHLKKNYKRSNFVFKKSQDLMALKIDENLFNASKLKKFYLNTNLIGIHSTNLIPNQNYFYNNKLKIDINKKNPQNRFQKSIELHQIHKNLEFLNHLLELDNKFTKLLNNSISKTSFSSQKLNRKNFFLTTKKKSKLGNVFNDYLKASILSDYLYSKFYLNLISNINYTFSGAKLLKQSILKLNFPILMSGYFSPETSIYSKQINFSENFLSTPLKVLKTRDSKKIKRSKGFLKLTIPPQVLIYDKIDNLYFQSFDFKNKKLNTKILLNSNLNQKKEHILKLSLKKLIKLIEKPLLVKDESFQFKSLNTGNLLLSKDFLAIKKSSDFIIKLQKLNEKSLKLKNKFVKRKDSQFQLVNRDLYKFTGLVNQSSLPLLSFKYRGNWSFYWNYFKTFYGSSFLLKPFNGIIYSSNFIPLLNTGFKKIKMTHILPGNNFLFEKWHPRKKEGFFYKRINKFNLKKIKSFPFSDRISKVDSSKRQFNIMVELLWGFRSKYKLEEVLQYQKSKYYQSKKAQQTTIDQNENQLNNNSKMTLQTVTKTLIKRKRYKKLIRFEVLSSWLRDVLYLRKISRKVSFAKKDLYLLNISKLFQKKNKSCFNNKFFNRKIFLKKLFVGSNLEQIQSLSLTQKNSFIKTKKSVLNQKYFEKLNVKLRNDRLIDRFKIQNTEKSFFVDQKVDKKSVASRIHSKKILLLMKNLLPLKNLNSDIQGFVWNMNRQKYFLKTNFLQQNLVSKLKKKNRIRGFRSLKTYSKMSFNPLIINHNSYLTVYNGFADFNSPKINKIYLNSVTNRILNLNSINNNFFFNILYFKDMQSTLLKDLNNYLINFINNISNHFKMNKKLKKNIFTQNSKIFLSQKLENQMFVEKFSHNKDKPDSLPFNQLSLRKNFITKLVPKNSSQSIFDFKQNKKKNYYLNLYTTTKSSYRIFENSKKLIHILRPKKISNNSFVKQKSIKLFKKNLIDCYKINLKNNWINKVYKTGFTIKTTLPNRKNLYESTKIKLMKNKNRLNPLTPIIMKFKNFSASFVIWRNNFKLRRDYLLLSYIYLDYVGALINEFINNCLQFLNQRIFFANQKSKFILLNNLNNFKIEKRQTNFPDFQQTKKADQTYSIFPFFHEYHYFYSQFYKNNLIKPKWSFLLLNHLKNQHTSLYEKLLEKNNTGKLYNTYFSTSKPIQSTSHKLEKNSSILDPRLVTNKEKKILQKNQIISFINLDSKVESLNPTNSGEINPSISFYRSILDSYNTNFEYSNLLLENKTKYIPIMDSSVNNNLYIKYQNQNLIKKILFMEKQKKFHNFFVSYLRPLINLNGNNNKTNKISFIQLKNQVNNTELKSINLKKDSFSLRNLNFKFSKTTNFLKPKLRRKTGIFKMRLIRKKTKIYNGIYLPVLQFANSVGLPIQETVGNNRKTQNTEKLLLVNNFFEGTFTFLISQVQLNNFLLCTMIFHICLIFSLLIIYKSSIHFSIKSLYSTMFVLNKYFVYFKYRIQRLVKYIYQNNFQTIIEYIQQKYYEKYIISFHFKLMTIFNFLFQRNSAFSQISRFKKSKRINSINYLDLKQKNLSSFFSILGNFIKFNAKKEQLSLKKLENTKSIRFFQYLTQSNLNKTGKPENLLFKKMKDSNFVVLSEAKNGLNMSTKFTKIFSSKNVLKLDTLNQPTNIINTKNSESKNLKVNFRVLRWNMFLTLLIGESEILAELEPYREMHWYFLKRFPLFLRTPAGKDAIGMVDYQADEKIRLIKQKIRQTVMILYLKSKKYESKLENQFNINKKSNQSFLKSRLKLNQWYKDSRNEKLQKTELKSEFSENLAENYTALENQNAEILLKERKVKFNLISFVSSFHSFYISKRKNQVRKISFWKSILTFLGKYSFVSRYAILNKRFRQSIILFSKPLVFFGPVGTIFLPYLIKSFILVFDSTSYFNKKFFYSVNEQNRFNKKQLIKYKKPGSQKLTLLKDFLSQIKDSNNNNLSKPFFSESVKSKLLKIYNLNLPFSQKDYLRNYLAFSTNTSFDKHLGNFNQYIRQKIENFDNFNAISQDQNNLLTKQFFTTVKKNRTPLFESDFLTNCQRFLKKYDRIYINFNQINTLSNLKQNKFRLMQILEQNFINSKTKVIFKKRSDKLFTSFDSLISSQLEQSLINSKNSRFMSFETFDPKLRYYRFSTNFSKVLSDVGGFNLEVESHQYLGPLICNVYTGLFFKQPSKNYLLVSGPNKPESLLFIIQALAGEMGMKLFLEDAKRLQRIGRRGINKATKRLEKLFDIAQANTPCLVFIEDIDVIGSKTKMIKVDEEQEDEEILVRSLLSKLIYRKFHKNKSLRETFMDQNLFLGGSSLKRRRSVKSTNPIPKSLVLYQLTRRRALSNYFLQQNNQFNRINSKLFIGQKLSPTFTTNAVLIWKLFKSKIATPDKRIKEAPWVHIPIDALRSIHPLTYSIRVKVAKITLLAIFTMGTRLRLVKDLIRLFEKTRYDSHNNFIVFATTTKLSYIDPALRRPGRLEEIISFSFLTRVSSFLRSSSFQSQLDTFKTHLKDLPGFSSTFNLIDSTLFSARLNLKEWSVINYLAEDAYHWDMFSFNPSIYEHSVSNSLTTKFNTKQKLNNSIFKNPNNLSILNKNNQIYLTKSFKQLENISIKDTFYLKLKKQRLTNYETLNTFNTLDNPQLIFTNLMLQRKKGLFDCNIYKSKVFNFEKNEFLIRNKIIEKLDYFTFFSFYQKNKSSIFAVLAYSQIGQSLISFLPVFLPKIKENKNKNNIFFDPDYIYNLKLWPVFKDYTLKSQNLFFNRRKNLKTYFLRFFSAKVGEFLFTSPLELNYDHNFIKQTDYFQSLQKEGFLKSIYGIQQNWALAHSYVMNLITTNCLYSKTPLLTRLLRIEDVNKPRQKQFFENLNAGILFEYSDFHYRTFLQKNVISMEETLNIFQSQKFMLNNQGRPLRKFVKLSINKRFSLFRSLFTDLGSLDEISLRPTSMNYYYRNKILLKQKLKISSYQWLNWHLRKPLDQLNEIQDIAYFPCAEKYYNPRHRRWMLTNGYWGYWFNFDKLFYDNLYEQYIFESFSKVYLHLDKNREILDYLAQLLITQETISETELFLSFKRYGI